MKLLKKTYKGVLAFVLIGLLFSSCNTRPTAMGVQDRLFVFADSALWQKIKDDVQTSFEHVIHTPRAERSFYVRWSKLSQLQGLKSRMNILFIGTTQTGNEVNDYLLKSLPKPFIDDVNAGTKFYFFKDALFARDQFSLFMLARDDKTFKENFAQLKGQIYDTFTQKYYSRLKETMFEQGEQKELESYLEKYFDYTLRVQHDYFVANQDLNMNYVWLRRMKPDRSLSVWHLPQDVKSEKFQDLAQARNKTIGHYYSGDAIVMDETKMDTVLFKGKPTPRMIGTWRNDSLLVGGPFRTFVVTRPVSGEKYLIDISVTAPEKRKKPYLDQLRVIAETFKFVDKSMTEKK